MRFLQETMIEFVEGINNNRVLIETIDDKEEIEMIKKKLLN